MNLRFVKTLFILFLITTIFFYPVCSKADDLEEKMESIVKDFGQKIGDVGAEKDYFIVVRSFFDKHTKNPSKLSEEIDDIIFQIIIDRYLGKKILVIFNWKSTKPLEKKAAVNAEEVYYKQGIWQKKLVENFGKGFLVTGTTEAIAGFVEIHAELIDMTTGKVLTSSKATIKGDAYEVGHTEKTPPTQQLAAVEAAPAIIATPSDKKKESEALQRDIPSKGKLYIETEPKGAAVKLLDITDNFYQGIALEPGRYQVEITAEGHEKHTQPVSIDVGKDSKLTVRLKPKDELKEL